MADERENEVQSQVPEKDIAGRLQQDTVALEKFGGFDIVETSIQGVQNLNPKRKARKNIFLTEERNNGERNELKARLQLWHDFLNESDDISELVDKAEERSQKASKLLTKNLSSAVEKAKDLERSYRSLALFFKNTEKDRLANVTIMNAEMEQLTDGDVPTFFEAVREEFADTYDRLDLRDNYSLLVLPGYLGSNPKLERWAKLAHKNKVMLVTDFMHLDSPEDVVDMFKSANLTGGDAYRSNVIMGCNWLVGREKHEELGEEEELYVPPSGALAGIIYRTLMSQVAAGKKFGGLNEVEGVSFDLRKSEIANLEKMGLVPMVFEYGKVMAFSAKTLFNGDNLGLQTYSVVRVFDWVIKVLMDFLNRRAFENFNTQTQKEIRLQIAKFLDSISGPGKLIQKFKIRKFDQDPKQKDRIYLDIHITPYFPAKDFMVKLDGKKGDDPDSADWEAEYEQM